MAEGVVSFGVQKLWELLGRESDRLQGVHEKVDDLKCQMRMLQSLLKDADAKKHGSEVVRNFLEDVKDIVFDAEDIIESFLLKELSGNQKGVKGRVKRFACFLVDRRGLSMDIEGITKRMAKVVGQMQSFGIQQIIYRSPSLQERQRPRENRQTYPKRSQKDLVGVEQSVNELVGHLVENDSIQVVSISGMGGIGKTTLARQVFHHDIVRSHFDGFAWICVSQDFKKKDIWQKLLQELRPHDTGIEQMNEDTLQAKIFHSLETSKYLIVMDDVWKNEDWDKIKDVFPQERGWKMILTSRNEGVGLHADPSCFPFRPKILTHEESWKLCESIAFLRREITEFNVDEELEAMGKKMVKYCGGLPLAVKVLGGLLANKTMVEEWKRVDDNIQTQIVRIDDNSQDSVYRVLSMSYEDLPTQLKHCFLYLAHFPEDGKIQVERLYYLWEAEGIITSSGNGATARSIGEDYIDELVRRNMVIGVKEELSCRWEYCQMHDMMRELCNLKIRYLDNLEEWIVEEGSMPCLRTLSIVYCKKLKELPEGLKYITSLKELKITDMNKEWKTKLVPDIWQWSELTSFGDLPTPRDFSAAAAIGNQKIVLCGGWDGKKWLSDVYVMDTMSLEWMELSVSGSLPPPRCGHTATMVEKRLLVFGGRGGCGPIMGDLWALKGLIDEERETPGWTQLKLPGQAPSSRCGHTVTSGGHYLLLFGGHGTGGWLSRYDVYYNDTIILDRDDPIAKRSSVPQLRNLPETKESERELDTERGQEGSTIVDLQKEMGISVSSGLRLQIPEESEDEEFVELGTRLIEGDVIDNRASMIQVVFSSCRDCVILVLKMLLNEKMAAEALRQHWKESTPQTLQLKELGSLLRDYQRLVTRKYTAQSSLTSTDFGLPGKQTFTFYHIRSSSELRMDDIPKLLEEYKTTLLI
ncbi:hypothetical protein YC2023_049307 [Brassica napus]